MKKLFLRLNQRRYEIIQLGQEQYIEIIGLFIDKQSSEFNPIPVSCRYVFKEHCLDGLFLALQPILGVEIEIDSAPMVHEMFIWPRFSIKKQEYKLFETIEESIAYDDRYEEYYNKRWQEIPKLEITIDHWEKLQEKWKQIEKELPKYLVFILDDSGPLDYIEIISKHELSQEDIQEIQIEHEQYLKYQQARQKYIDNHPDYSGVWRGPEDDEYDADIMKYYEK